jgi:hypothetical protein
MITCDGCGEQRGQDAIITLSECLTNDPRYLSSSHRGPKKETLWFGQICTGCFCRLEHWLRNAINEYLKNMPEKMRQEKLDQIKETEDLLKMQQEQLKKELEKQ